jgi:hypothetical protein
MNRKINNEHYVSSVRMEITTKIRDPKKSLFVIKYQFS